MGLILLILCIFAAIALLAFSFQGRAGTSPGVRTAARASALVLVLLGLAVSSAVYVPSDRVGIVTKNWLGATLKDGRVIAVDGEMGAQADVLRAGLHFGYWPFLFSVDNVDITVVPPNQVGLIESADGKPMEPGQLFAEAWSNEEFQAMLDARHFLTKGNGRKGKQVSVLTPGSYPLNTRLYSVRMVDQTEILQGEVGVLKSNFGAGATEFVDADTGKTISAEDAEKLPPDRVLGLARAGEMGIRRDVLRPGKYPINTDAYTVVELFQSTMVAHFAAVRAAGGAGKPESSEEREIRVTTSDGFKFPVDVRIEYRIEEADAPLVVASLGDDEGERFRAVLNSIVRAIFRNNAEKVRALDYVQQRSQQEAQSLQMIAEQMRRFGVRVTGVRIGDVGDDASLGSLLKTQTDRELAKQEQLTFKEQQAAAEQKKQLSKAQQEAEEEKRLATAAYGVKIASEEQKRRVTEAQAEAESIRIKADAQANAYRQIAEQIGKSNAAMIELLKIVGEKGIQITPRIFVAGAGAHADPATTALMGTMLDQMVRDEEKPPAGGTK